MPECSYKTGDKIIAEGTFGDGTYRIVSGSVRIVKETGGEEPVVLANLSDGELFGEMYVFSDVGFRSASAIAETNVTLHLFEKGELESELKGTPQIIQDILLTVNGRLEATSQHFSMVTVRRTKWERIANKMVVALFAGVLVAQVIILFKPCP